MSEPRVPLTLTHRVICRDTQRWGDARAWCVQNLGEASYYSRMTDNTDATWYYLGGVFRFARANDAFEFKLRFG